eukprot:m.138199 g.138199  ORF g.138199 m.138199 type:complete len:431 (+) comp11481_c0_seq2:32-1324(+)
MYTGEPGHSQADGRQTMAVSYGTRHSGSAASALWLAVAVHACITVSFHADGVLAGQQRPKPKHQSQHRGNELNQKRGGMAQASRGDLPKKSMYRVVPQKKYRAPTFNWNHSHFVFYNRLPKAGSTTMITLLTKLEEYRSHRKSVRNVRQFNIYNCGNDHYHMQHPFQIDTEWTFAWKTLSSAKKKASRYVGAVFINHMVWVNFSKYGYHKPLAIQMVRDPVDRAVSSYYYGLWGRPEGDERMPRLRASYQETAGLNHTPTINEWVAWKKTQKQYQGCANREHGNGLTSYFCGFDPVCDDICSEAAMERAKRVLVEEYASVGLVEHFRLSLQLFEAVAPEWFQNLTDIHDMMVAKKSGTKHNNDKSGENAKTLHANVTPRHEPANEETKQYFRENLAPDMELYRFALEHFERMAKKYHLLDDNATLSNSGP